MKDKEQFRIIRNPDNLEETKIPVMPLLIISEDGTVGEAKTLRGAVALVIGNQYLDAEDGIDEWHYRLEASRKEAMKAIQRDVYAVTYDKNKGIIDYNYAAEPGDPDYEIETAAPPFKIRIENERLFLLSLMQIGSISIMEREDSFLLKLNDKTSSFTGNNAQVEEYPGGIYINIAEQYDLEEFIKEIEHLDI